MDFATSAEAVCRDRIHIVIDLNGYSTGARSELFPYRPAPVQLEGSDTPTRWALLG